MNSYSYHHHAVSAHHHAYTHYNNGGGWFGHAILSGMIRAAIAHMIEPLFRGQGILGAVLIGVVLLGCVWFMGRWMSRRRFA